MDVIFFTYLSSSNLVVRFSVLGHFFLRCCLFHSRQRVYFQPSLFREGFIDENVETNCSVSSPELSTQGLPKTLQVCDHLFDFCRLINPRGLLFLWFGFYIALIVFERQQQTLSLLILLDVFEDHLEVKNPYRFSLHRLNI